VKGYPIENDSSVEMGHPGSHQEVECARIQNERDQELSAIQPPGGQGESARRGIEMWPMADPANRVLPDACAP
jgi:hypothetical protein